MIITICAVVNKKRVTYRDILLATNLNITRSHFQWYAILLDYTAEIEGRKKRIQNSYLVKQHLQVNSLTDPFFTI